MPIIPIIYQWWQISEIFTWLLFLCFSKCNNFQQCLFFTIVHTAKIFKNFTPTLNYGYMITIKHLLFQFLYKYHKSVKCWWNFNPFISIIILVSVPIYQSICIQKVITNLASPIMRDTSFIYITVGTLPLIGRSSLSSWSNRLNEFQLCKHLKFKRSSCLT